MTEWEYIRLMSRNYLQVRIEQQQFEELFQYRMMISVPIKGLLGCRTRELNGSAYLLYDISSMQNLRSLYTEKKMDFSAFYQLIYSLGRTVKNMKEYLLEVENLLLYPEFIFQELDTKEINFVYYPCVYAPASDSTRKFYDFLLSVIDHEDDALTEIVYQSFERIEDEDGSSWLEALYKKLNEVQDARNKERESKYKETEITQRAEQISHERQKEYFFSYAFVEDSEKALEKKDKEPEKNDKEPGKNDKENWKRCKTSLVISLLYACMVGLGIYYLYANYVLNLQENIITWVALVVITALLAFWMFLWLKKEQGRTAEPIQEKKEVTVDEYQEMLDEKYVEDNSYGKTIFFETEEIENKLYGIGKKNRRIIRLNKFPFVIGKKEGSVDGVIEEVSVSRIHARFYKQGSDVLFLEDLNSTNGTYKNGIMLAPHEKVEVLPEDEIRFGKLQFIYR